MPPARRPGAPHALASYEQAAAASSPVAPARALALLDDDRPPLRPPPASGASVGRARPAAAGWFGEAAADAPPLHAFDACEP